MGQVISLSPVPFSGVSGMTHSQSVKVCPQVVTAKCSEPQVESREAGMEEEV